MGDLPERVVRHFTVSEAEAGQKLLSYLKRRLSRDLPEALLHRIIRDGEVRVNGKRSKPFARLEENDDVRVPPLRVHKDDTPIAPPLTPAAANGAPEPLLPPPPPRTRLNDGTGASGTAGAPCGCWLGACWCWC